MHDLRGQIDDLDAEQLEFLRRRLQRSAHPAATLPRVERIPRAAGHYLLSPGQRRLWFQDRLEPGNPVYNVGILVRVTGELPHAIFRRALDAVVRRHEALRTTFESEGGEPVQVIAPELSLPLPIADLGGLPAAVREPEAHRLAEGLAAAPFDLLRGPLLRLTLLGLKAGEALLLVAFHHLAADGWSFGLFVRDLATACRAMHRGEPAELPELAVQYVDFAAWQRELLRRPVIERQLAYWMERLADAPPVLDLPLDRPRPPLLGTRAHKEHLVVPAAAADELSALAERAGATLFMACFAAFQVLLYRYTDEQDLVVGAPIAYRNRAELEGVIGFFANTLALRSRCAPGEGFADLLARVRETTLGAFAHQDLPFERLVEALRPERSLSHQPLFQVLFAFQNFRLNPEELPNVRLAPLDWEVARSPFDLSLFVTPKSRGLTLAVRVNLHLYEPTTARRMLGHLENLLRAATIDPARPLAALSLLSAAEEQQLAAWGTWQEGEVRLLGAGGEQVPIGVPGEVHLAGFPTGELARFRADGSLERLGRRERMVRAGGFRVVPENVEARLLREPGFTAAAVTGFSDSGGRGRLVAYIAASAEARPSVTELRERLRRELPEHLIPAVVVFLDALPETPGGAVDWSRLPTPEIPAPAGSPHSGGRRGRSDSVLFTPFILPSTPLEERLAALFRELLELDEVGVHDNFFELGGHSLLGTVLMSRLQDACGIELPVLRLFEAPTVAGLASLIAAATGDAARDSIERISDGTAGVAAVDVDELSDAQVDSLLATLLPVEGAPG